LNVTTFQKNNVFKGFLRFFVVCSAVTCGMNVSKIRHETHCQTFPVKVAVRLKVMPSFQSVFRKTG